MMRFSPKCCHHGYVAPWIPSLRPEPIRFAHRGASAHAPENTLEAFELALRLGANGLESDVWVTSDGHPVLDHDGKAWYQFRRRSIGSVPRNALGDHIPTITELFEHVEVGSWDFSLDIKDAAAAASTVDAVRAFGEQSGIDIASRTWFCHPDIDAVTDWRSRWPDIRVVHSTRVHRLDTTPERHAAELAERGIDAVNFRAPDWSGGLCTLYHRFGVQCFGWDVQIERVAAELLNIGLDGLFGDHVDRLENAYRWVYLTDHDSPQGDRSDQPVTDD